MLAMRSLTSRLLNVLSGRYNNMLDGKIMRLRKLFDQLDQHIDLFKKETSLSCLKSCGYCCAHSSVEVSEAEMLPMADMLFHRGDVDEWYQKVSALTLPKQCIFYQPEEKNISLGKCSCYAFRPLICRFFSFTAQEDKHGKLRLIVCKLMKQHQTDLVEKAQDAVMSQRSSVAVMSDYLAKASFIDPTIGVELLPINMAFKKAVELVWLYRRYTMKES